MADPKIRYDIEAGIKGEPDVAQLAQTVRRLGDTLEGDLKTQAVEAADALEQLGAKRDAVASFQRLTNESGALAIELAETVGRVNQLTAELPAAAAATQQFALAEGEARAQVDRATEDLKAQRAALAALKADTTTATRGTDEYKAAQAQLAAKIKEGVAEVKAKKAALAAATAEATSAATAEKKLAVEFTNAGTAAVRASDAVKSNTAALAATRSQLQSFGVATENAAQAERNLEAAIGKVRERVVALAPAFAQAATASSSATGRQITDQERLAASMQGVRNQLQAIQTIASVAVGGSFVTGLIKGVAETADEYKNLQARMSLVTGEGENFQRSFKGVTEVALATHSPLEATGNLFAKLAKTSQDAGLSARDASLAASGLTTTINQAIQLSGASADASSAAITQLIQGLQSGVLRGDEFNSVMEQAPRLAQALADGLGKTTGELRKMAEQGALTSNTVIQALTTQSDKVAAEFAKLPLTVGRSLQDLQTRWMLYVGEADNGMASSANLARVIDGLSKNLDGLVTVLFAAGKAWAAIKLAGLATDLYKYVTATTASTAALAGNTAALVGNTTAQVANAAAGRAGAASATAQAAAVVANTQRIATAGSVLGRFGFLAGPAGIALAALTPEIISVGTALGEGIAKWQGYGKAMQDAEGMARANDEAAQANAKSLRELKIKAEEAERAQFGLTTAAATAVTAFDAMRVKGDSAAEAIEKIGKGFDLSTVPGVRDAGVVLDRLLSQGKLTAEQFEAAWAQALNGQDLLKFEVLARTAFSGSAREAERMAAVLDGTAREAIRRTGLDFDLLAGGMSTATRKVLSDNDVLIAAFDRLKAQGVNVGQALAVSLSKAIDTADGQKALDALIVQIDSVRTKLGDKVADGLLDQAKGKATELAAALASSLPGIQSVAEAMKNLGVTSDKSLKDTADQAKKSYDYLRDAGTVSTRELAAAFTKYATDTIAANKGIATDALKAEAAVRGVTIAIDAAGKATVGGLSNAATAVKTLAGAYVDLGAIAKAQAAAAVDALERQIQAQERANDLTQRAIDLENKRKGVDSSGFAANAAGQRIVAGGDLTSLTGIAAFLKSAGVSDDAQARSIAKEFANTRGQVTSGISQGQLRYGGAGSTISEALLKAAESVTFGSRSGGTTTPGSTIPQANETRTINFQLNVGGQSYGALATDAAGAGVLQNFLGALQNAKATST